MTNLKFWEDKIKEKRKKTNFKDFVKEIASWSPLNYYKNWDYISIFPKSNRINKIVSIEKFNNSRDNLLSLDYIYDNFFEGLLSLQKNVTTPCVRQYWICINAEYTDIISNIENCFLIRCSPNCKNVWYSIVIKNTENVFNCIKVQWWEWNIYSSFSVDESFNIFYSKCIENSSNIWFSYDLVDCHECLFCNDLNNKSYYIYNISYAKDIYLQKKEEILSQKANFQSWFTNLWWHNYKTINSENVENVYWWTNVINWRNCIIVWNPIWTKNIYDTLLTWTLWDYYWCADSGVNSEKIYCSVAIVNSNTIFYSQFLEGCSFCIGCIWLKNKSFCILNKQYTKEEWYELVDKIFTKMNSDWILWNFFPWSLNPFYFNDTVAYLLDNTFTKEEIIADWYLWRDEEIKVDIPEWTDIINVKDLDIVNFDESILKKIIVDKNWNYYKIVKMEYDFLKKHNLPLPEIHWLDRIKLWFKF